MIGLLNSGQNNIYHTEHSKSQTQNATNIRDTEVCVKAVNNGYGHHRVDKFGQVI